MLGRTPWLVLCAGGCTELTSVQAAGIDASFRVLNHDWEATGAGTFGRSVSSAGDVNGDGFDDVLVGAPFLSDPEFFEGGASLYLGSALGLEAVAAWAVEGDDEHANVGESVAGAGDVNGDGFDDVVIGTPDGSLGGRADVYLGSATGLQTIPVWTVDAEPDTGRFGERVASAGDVNGDGFDDIIVGDSTFDNDIRASEGAAFVYHGSATGPELTPAWRIEGSSLGEKNGVSLGSSVASAGDVNGDGFDDVVVGAVGYRKGPGYGRSLVYHGSSAGLATEPAWAADWPVKGWGTGESSSSAGDVNGDGFDDVVVGAVDFFVGGRALLYLGSSLGLRRAPDWTVSLLDPDMWMGFAVATAGDVNGDGLANVVVGAPHSSFSQTGKGMASVYLGSGTGLATLAAWTERSKLRQFGYSVASAGDVNGDGFDDLIVGSPDDTLGTPGGASVFLGCGDPLDGDADTIGDACDDCPGFDDRLDADLDGLPDGCDP